MIMIWLTGGFYRWRSALDGATAIEYGLIAGGISLAIVTAIFLLGDNLGVLFDTIAGKMAEAAVEIEE